MRYAGVAALSVFLWTHPAAAETVTNASQIKPGTKAFAYLFTRDQTAEMRSVGGLWDRELGLQQGCKENYRMQVRGITLVTPIELPEDKPHPVRGSWILRFTFERCAETKIYNALFIAKNGDKPEVKPYFPGATNASPKLVSEAMQGAVATAGLKLGKQGTKDCKVLKVFDMRVTSPSQQGGPWREDWTFLGCGTRVDVKMTFTPDGKGGVRYSATES